jgi:hypothetical protein
MQVSELTGPLLDYWVAKAEGFQCAITHSEALQKTLIMALNAKGEPFYPSESWDHGGPIIEREEIHIAKNWRDDSQWTAAHGVIWFPTHEEWIDGPTPLIAAMRAYVASKFGDTVPDMPAVENSTKDGLTFRLDDKSIRAKEVLDHVGRLPFPFPPEKPPK